MLSLLEKASVFVHLDPRVEGVLVPDWFAQKTDLVLQMGLNLTVPIPDLHVDDEGISGTLSFNRTPYFCRMPWPAVYALVGENGRGMMWPDDIPPEVAARASGERAKQKPALRAVPGGADTSPSDSADAVSEGSSGPVAGSRSKTGQRRKSGSSAAHAKAQTSPRKNSGGRAADAGLKPGQAAKSAGPKLALAPEKQSTSQELRDVSAPPKPQVVRTPAAQTPAKPAAGKQPEGPGQGRKLPPYLRIVK